MPDRIIPQRELRNRVSEILHAAEAGQTFTVTVRGRPVARVVPPAPAEEPRVDVDRATVRALLSQPIDAEELGAELDAVEEPLDDPWPT